MRAHISLSLLLVAGNVFADDNAALEACLRETVITASPELTIAELRAACEEKLVHEAQMHEDIRDVPVVKTAAEVDERLAAGQSPSDSVQERRERLEEISRLNPFVITPHRQNYLLPITYNRDPNQDPFAGTGSKIERPEAKFQISLKVPLLVEVFGQPLDLWLAYTGTSWWQVYNRPESRPFRETNHEPELFLDWKTGWDLWGVDNTTIRLGVNHQSNGRDVPFSRSWNRVFAHFILSTDNMLFSFKPWWRVPEESKSSPTDPTGDDNPNIERFAGQAEFLLAWKYREQNFSIRHRSNLRSDYRGGVELGYTFPINKRVRGYVQYYNGYAESLIDYNAHSNRIGIGLLLTDWL